MVLGGSWGFLKVFVGSWLLILVLGGIFVVFDS